MPASASEKSFFCLILCAYLLVGALYARHTPPWQAPDEPAHYNYIRQVAERGCCPRIEAGDWDSAYLETLKAQRFAPPYLDKLETIQYEDHHPPLYYLLASLVYKLSADGEGRLIALRLFSLALGAGSVGLSFAVALLAAISFLQAGVDSHVVPLWNWISVAGFSPGVNLYLDGLSLVMMLVITGVGFLIHVYSLGYMADDPGFSRFFCYMNLFVCSMLLLVLGDNLLLLYLGWEGVGLCSYLLIGFWYDEPANGYAARKAFVVTRVGDTAMAIGLFLLFAQLGTLNIQELLHAAEHQQRGDCR